MAISLFTRMIDAGEEIPIFGDGTSKRDYTYVNDIVDGIARALISQNRGTEICNLGNSYPVSLEYLVYLIEEALGKMVKIKSLPVQPADVPITLANISPVKAFFGYQPKV